MLVTHLRTRNEDLFHLLNQKRFRQSAVGWRSIDSFAKLVSMRSSLLLNEHFNEYAVLLPCSRCFVGCCDNDLIRPLLKGVEVMSACIPIKDLKDTATFTQKVEQAEDPITVTRNGYDVFVVMKTDEYESMRQEIVKTHLMARMMQAERELAAGRYADGEEFIP